MDVSFTFRSISATDGLKTHTLQKLTKLDHYFIKPESIHVICFVNKTQQCAEITVLDNGHRYVSTENHSDMYASIDQAIDKLVRQLKRQKEIIKDKRHAKPAKEVFV